MNAQTEKMQIKWKKIVSCLIHLPLQSSATSWASPTRPSSTGYWLRCSETRWVRTQDPSLEKQTCQRAQWNLKYSALLYVGLSVSVTQQKLHTLEKMIWFHFKAPLINISILFEWNANEAPPLFVQTRRWRFGWISTAGRRTRKDKSLSSTRRRVSSPRTSWRRSTLRVSADKNWQKLQY